MGDSAAAGRAEDAVLLSQCADVAARVRAHIARTRRTERLTFCEALEETVAEWTAYLREHPRDRAVTRAALFELDPAARAAAVAAMNAEYRDVVAALISDARAQGHVRDDVDTEDLAALLTTVLPHLALAPALDPPGHDTAGAVRDLLRAVAPAFSAEAPA